MADLDLSVGIDTAAAEEGLRRLTNDFHREMRSIDRTKAEAKVGADTTKLDKKIAEAKRKLLDLQKQKADPNVDLDTKEFDAEVLAVKAKLKELGQQKTELRVNSQQLRDANREAALSAKRQEAMAKQTERLDREKAKLARTTERETNNFFKQRSEIAKLRQSYNKLANDAAYLEKKTGRPGGLFHTEKERLALEKLRADMASTEHRIRSLGGSVDDINPDLEDNQNILRKWGTSLAGARLHLGFFSASLKAMGVGLVLLGPLLTGVLGAATSLVGVLGTGLAGAAVVGAAGFAGLAASIAGAIFVIKPIVSEIGEATKASEAYHKAVLKYGKGSEEAATAQEKLAQTLKGISPGARSAIKEVGHLKEEWRSLTQPARKPVFEDAAEGIKTVRSLMPTFAHASVEGIQIVSEAWDRWMAKLRGNAARGGIKEILANLNAGLPSLLRGFEALGEAIGRITVSASRFIPGLNRGFAEWAENLNRSVGYGNRLDENIGRLVHDMRDLGHLSQATGRLIIALFNSSADSGDGLVNTLTQLFNHWADWMNTVEGRRSLRRFFHESAEEASALFALLGRLVGMLFQMSRATAPISDSFVKLLTVVASIVEAASKVGVLNDTLKLTGEILAGLWAVNKVKAFGTAVAGAARALGLLAAAEGAVSAAGTAGVAVSGAEGAAGAAAGRATAGGIAGGILAGLKRVKWAKIGAVGLGLGLLNGVVDEVKNNSAKASANIVEAFKAKLNTESLFEKGTGIHLPDWLNPTANKLQVTDEEHAVKNLLAQYEEILRKKVRISEQTERSLKLQAQEVDMTKEQRTQINNMFRLTKLGRNLDIRVTGNMNPGQLSALLAGYTKLRSGALASLGDIGKVMRENARLISTVLPRGSEEARRKTAENFRDAAAAIEKAMKNETISVRDGTRQMKQYLTNARLLEGRDPLGLAKGFADSWRQAGAINKRNSDKAIEQLRTMPPRARQEAFQMMLAYGRGLVRGGKVPENDLRLFKSHALTEVKGISGGFHSLSGSIYEALANIGQNLSQALKSMGVGKPPHFNLNKLIAKLPQISELPPLNAGGGQQQGGFTVAGSGSGDTKPHILPEGSFVMNREATSRFGLNRGGPVATILEPKEHVFLPPEVKRIGAGRLQAMNDAVPRKQGGPVGDIPLPQLIGPAGSAHDVGTAAINKAHEVAARLLAKQRQKFVATSGGLGFTVPIGPIQKMAAEMVSKIWGMGQWAPFNSLEMQEAGWNPRAQNPSSGAAGLAQALPPSKYPPGAWPYSGLDSARLQLEWMMSYIKERYGNPAGAWAHEQSAGWYKAGGLVQALAGGGGVWRGTGPTGLQSGIRNMASFLMGKYPGLSVSSTTGGEHAAGSLHYSGHAVDMVGGNMDAEGSWIAANLASALAEGIHNPTLSVKDGSRVSSSIWGPSTWADHLDHIHLAVTQPWKAAEDAPGSGRAAGTARQVPKAVKATYNTYRTTPGGGIIGIQHKDQKVQVEVPEFGPIPKDEEGIKRELHQCEKVLLPQYHAAYKQQNRKDIKAKLKESLKKIETRIRELRAALREMRAAKARKRTKKKLAKQLGKITGQEPLIEAAEREYEKRNQDAEQIVALEPEQTGEISHDWLERIFEPYVRGQEEPAYQAVLGAENDWRNTVLSAQEEAERITKGWEIQIGWPQDGRKPWLENPDLHFPPRPGNGDPTALALWIYQLHDAIERIQNFAHSHPPAWWQEHPNARDRRDRELDEIKTYFRPKMEAAKFRRSSLTEVLAEGRESFNWFNGTGSFEDSLQSVQGIHWPDQHEKLPGLPAEPVPGVFGGAIWDTQETIRGLGLKINQAKESLEGVSGTEKDKGAEIEAFEEAIRGLLAGRPFSIDTHRGPQPFMGAFARGGVALVGEHGPELAHLPDRTRIHNAEETARMLEPEVVVDIARLSRLGFGPRDGGHGGGGGDTIYDVDNHFAAPPPDPHTWAKQQRFELETLG